MRYNQLKGNRKIIVLFSNFIAQKIKTTAMFHKDKIIDFFEIIRLGSYYVP